jgi:sigma-E factor negative regulatory protein RseC
VDLGKALVAVSAGEACTGCKGEGTCGLSGARKGRSLWVLDPLGVKPGDRVRVELSDEGLLAASFVLYGIPLAGLLIGALVGQVTGGEKRSFIGAAVGMLASIPFIRLLGNRIPERSRFAARIVESESPHPAP